MKRTALVLVAILLALLGAMAIQQAKIRTHQVPPYGSDSLGK